MYVYIRGPSNPSLSFQCVAVCCSVLQCCSAFMPYTTHKFNGGGQVGCALHECLVVCCSVSGALQCVAVCCSVLQSVAVCCSALH